MAKQGKLIVYSGPSGVGKGTLLAPLLEDETSSLVLSVSATTRTPRPGEIDGVHYHFVTEEEFLNFIQREEMLEYAQYNGNYYGTPRGFVELELQKGKNVVLEIEVQGAALVLQKFPQALAVFVMPPSFEELERRLRNRGTESPEQLVGRLKIAINELSHAKDYDFIILNDNLAEARANLLCAVAAADCLTRFNTKLINEVRKNA